MITWEYSDGGPAGYNPQLPQYVERALDPVTWDVVVPATYIRGPDAVIQRIRVRFNFFLGEWFLDQSLGVPYIQSILVADPNLALCFSIFRKVLVTTPGVERVVSIDGALDNRTRILSVDWQIVLTDSAIATAVDETFQITTLPAAA